MEGLDENDEMAAMMGFSSFGGTKKRKFDQARSPAKDEYSASGANSTELGLRTKASNNEQSSDKRIPSVALQEQSQSAGGLASFLARGQALPAKPPKAASVHQAEATHVESSASELISFGGPSIPRAEINALRFGVKDANGDFAYFLPSFVEDPWQNLSSSRT